MKVAVKGHLCLPYGMSWEEALKKMPEFLKTLHDYDAYLELDDEQVFPDGCMVMLVDPEGEIEDEGPAEVMGYEGTGTYCVCIPEEYRTSEDDVDGLREVDHTQMQLIDRIT